MEESVKKRLELIQAYKDTFSNPQGQLVLNDLVDMFILRSYAAETNPSAITFHEGERHVVLRILNEINCDSRAIIERIEHNAKKKYTL